MKKNDQKQLTLNRKTLFAFAGSASSRNGYSTERTTITISSLNPMGSVQHNKK